MAVMMLAGRDEDDVRVADVVAWIAARRTHDFAPGTRPDGGDWAAVPDNVPTSPSARRATRQPLTERQRARVPRRAMESRAARAGWPHVEDPTFVPRVLVGAGVLVALACLDRLHKGSRARLWRELSFLSVVAVGAIFYAIGHDVVTRAISPEYFTLGKGVADAADGFGAGVASLAASAGWSAGSFVGLVMIVANNPTADRRAQLPYRTLARYLAFPVIGAATSAAAIGALGWAGRRWILGATGLDLIGLDDPEAFVTVWAIHSGSYVGVLVGSALGAVLVRAERARPVAASAAAPWARS